MRTLALRLLLSCILPGLPAASAEPVTPSSAPVPASAEALIREYEALARKGASAADYDRFISAHPALLKASARPYGLAFLWVLEFEQTEAALALLRAGAAVPDSALALAARGGLDGLVRQLLARGVRDDAEGSALHAAAQYGHASTLKLLLAHGANAGAKAQNDGFTALHLAVMGRHVEAVRVLLAGKAPIEARDHEGRTPLAWGPFAYRPQPKHIYRKLGQPHDTVHVDPGEAVVINLLLDAGARIDAVDQEGDTPLHEAVRLRSLRGAQALVLRGAKVDAKNRAGETPLTLAKQRKDAALIDLLTTKR